MRDEEQHVVAEKRRLDGEEIADDDARRLRPQEPALTNEPITLDRARRRDQLGGLLHEYELAA